jgi:hypothetical protein
VIEAAYLMEAKRAGEREREKEKGGGKARDKMCSSKVNSQRPTSTN